jgi:NADH-quinone oxidoreductase subunit M
MLPPENLLIAAVFLPLLGAVVLWITAPAGRDVVRWIALGVTLATLALTAVLVFRFPADGVGEYALTSRPWLAISSDLGLGLDVQFSLALDGLGVWLFGLTALLMVTCVLVSWRAIEDRPALFYGMLLLLEFGCLGVFTARDILLFYVFFEFTLLPLFFLIGIWGSEERRYAAVKFFLFTLAGSVLTFLGILAIVLFGSPEGSLTFSIPELTERLRENPIPAGWQLAVFIALFAGFAIKVPLFPLHTWLPLAHTQAPTAGSVFLAGLLLKIGIYGFLRFSIPMLPEATALCLPWLLWLSVIGIVYGALVALAQADMKRLIAYSSVSHLGFCMLGVFALTNLSVQGGALQMINHGLSTGALFAIVGMLYERYHTRQISHVGGVARRLPLLSFFMLFFTLSSIGLPGLNGFAGEFLLLVGTFQRAFAEAAPAWRLQYQVVAVAAVTGIVLGAWYMLWLVQRVFFGPLKEPHAPGQGQTSDHEDVRDLSLREVLSLAPLAVFVLWIGLWPQFFLSRMQPTLEQLTSQATSIVAEQATESADSDELARGD